MFQSIIRMGVMHMDGFTKRTLEKQRNIIDKTYALFKERGIKKTNIQDIARHANVSQVSIYNYFKNKEGLFLEVVKMMLVEDEKRLQTIIDAELSFKAKLSRFIHEEIIRYDQMHPDFVVALNDVSNRKLNALYDIYTKERFGPKLIELINTGKKLSEISNNYSDRAIIQYLKLYNHLREYRVYEDKELMKEMMALFFYGLTGGDAHD